MNKALLWMIAGMAIFGFGSFSGFAAEGKVSVLQGSAAKKTGEKPWNGLKVRDSVAQGDRVKTRKKSLAEVQLPGNQTIRLGPQTTVDFSTVFADGEKTVSELDIEEGDLWAEVEKLGDASTFKVSSGMAHASVRGTIFSFHSDDEHSVLNVYRGAVEMRGQTPTTATDESKGSHEVAEPHEVSAPHEVAGPHEVGGPREVSMHHWLQVIKAMQQIEVSKDGSWRVRDISDKETFAHQWLQWNQTLKNKH